MLSLKQYLIDEIEEERRLGYVSPEEAEHRLALLAGRVDPTPRAPSGTEATGSGGGGTVDPAIQTAEVHYPSDEARIEAYLARPAGDGPFPGVIVVHENKGLVEHIKDVARRLARAGYVALAPDLLSRVGGTGRFASPADATAALGQQPHHLYVSDLLAAVRYLTSLPEVQADRLGAVGFCFGGGLVWQLATRARELKAAVPFYGVVPPLEEVGGIRAAVLAIYGELDERINQGIPAITEAMERHGKTFEKIIYPRAQHAFHNDANPDRYQPEAAHAAWQATLDWFDRYLRR